MANKAYLNILNENQREILPKLKFLRGFEFYLAGGTALALQIDHRTSLDFDFYARKEFESEELVREFRKFFRDLKIVSIDKNTLYLEIKGISLSFFYYPYALLEKTVLLEGVELASLKDLAAMKIGAIIGRGTRRDFIDVYYLLEDYSLNDIISFTLKKYPGYDVMLILRSLIYFEDADEERNLARGIKVFDEGFNWNFVTERLISEVKMYQEKILGR